MSTSYRPDKSIQFDKVFDGRLRKYGIDGEIFSDKSGGCLRSNDGGGPFFVHREENGTCTFVRRALVLPPALIIRSLEAEFATDIYCEHDPRYWGFETEEEWDAAVEEQAREHEEQAQVQEEALYQAILRYVCDEPHGLTLGTDSMAIAEMAKKLISNSPTLKAPEHRTLLLAAARDAWQRKMVDDGEIPF